MVATGPGGSAPTGVESASATAAPPLSAIVENRVKRTRFIAVTPFGGLGLRFVPSRDELRSPSPFGVAPHPPAGDDLRVFVRGVLPGEVAGVDQVQLAVGQPLVEVPTA